MDTKRATLQESFEVYPDQMDDLERLQVLYQKQTGKLLAKSRGVREELDMFLPLAFDAYKDEEVTGEV